MTREEYISWSRFMKSCRGRWNIDLIHNGKDGQDLLMFKPHPTDPTRGVYIGVKQNGHVTAGTYDGALPHVGDAMFYRAWEKHFGSFRAAKAKVLERTNMLNGGL